MASSSPESHRAPPDETQRITSSGADQFVLACRARRDARDDTFTQIELFEAEVRELRKQLAWAESHRVTRTARYVRSRLFVMACVVTTVLATLGWFLVSPLGRLYRVQLVRAAQAVDNPKLRRVDGRAFLIRDIPQPEIDAYVRDIDETYSPFLGP